MAVVSKDPPRLSVSARYRLEIVSRGPRLYASEDYQIKALARRGLVELSSDEGKFPRWKITEAGLAALENCAEPRNAAQTAEDQGP